MRNDMPCGSTIGPILAHNLGCRTVDVGMPQLSMHSIREMAGVDDVMYSYKHFREFFRYQQHCLFWREPAQSAMSFSLSAACNPAGMVRNISCCSTQAVTSMMVLSLFFQLLAPSALTTDHCPCCCCWCCCCFRTFSAVDASLDVDSLPPPDIKGTIRDRACSHVH